LADFNIQVGATDGFRYIGIEPPLDAERKELVLGSLGKKTVSEAIGNGRCIDITKPFKGSAYSEISLTTQILGRPSPESVAVKIADVLSDSGSIVSVDLEPKEIGYGHYLFGGQAERLG